MKSYKSVYNSFCLSIEMYHTRAIVETIEIFLRILAQIVLSSELVKSIDHGVETTSSARLSLREKIQFNLLFYLNALIFLT